LILRRALLGGTFDPPHIGHLSVAQAAWEQLPVDVVSFMPAGEPWQKTNDRTVTPATIRCEMVEAAIEGIPYFELDRSEAERQGPTYTWDTIASFNGDDVVLVLGSDAAAGIRSWYRGDQIVETIQIAVIERPGTPRSEVEAVIPGVRWLAMPALDISSSELREWLSEGFSGRFIVPDAVLTVIEAHDLYSDPNQD
jgi:nicotinate-nucleotide adenylyltransferase